MISTNASPQIRTTRPTETRNRRPPAGLAPTRRAFATITAIVLLGLAAATLAALAGLFSADYRRTRDARADAQLRQLLIAGAADVSEKVKAWPDSPPDSKWDVSVPKSLAADGGYISNQSVAGENQTIEMHVKAGYLARAVAQTLRYHHEAGRWTLTDVTIDPGVH